MQKSAVLNPQKAQKASLTAIKHYGKKRLKEGRKQVSHLLSSNWKDPNTFFQTGIAAFNAGDIDASASLYEKAIMLAPSNHPQLSNMFTGCGSAFSSLGKYEDAIEYFDKAIKQDAKNDRALNNRALANIKLGNKSIALEDLKKAHALSPDKIGILLNLGDLLTSIGEKEKACVLYEKQLFLDPDNSAMHLLVGNLKKEEKPLEAFKHYRKAVYLDPKNSSYLQAYSKIFERLPTLTNFEGIEKDLTLLLSSNVIKWNYLSRIVRSFIRNQPAFKDILPQIMLSVKENTELTLDYGKVIKALSNNVLLLALKNMRLIDPEIEKILELFRRQTLAAIISDTKLEKPLIDLLKTFLGPLARYCFFSEYVFAESPFEKEALDTLIHAFEAGEEQSTDDTTLRFLILCCYRQSHRYSFAKGLCETQLFKKDPLLSQLAVYQVKEPLIELASYSKIPKLTPIEDSISLSVQEQYEENPYPRWQSYSPSGVTSYAKHLARILPALEGKVPSFPGKPDLLIAGCGTGRQPISSAITFPETDVLAVDLSLASIAYAKRKADELKVKNITFGQADIMELSKLDRKFHIIECAGVLHHMNNPLAGWRVLCDLLHDDGYMNIGLYSELGRKDVVASRQFIQENGYGDNVEDIRSCRKHLMSLDKDHPAKRISEHSDFYTTSACRDLIFHVQEHRFTVPLLIKAMEELGLEFLGFNLDYKQMLPKFIEMFPDDPFRTDLNNWTVFEEEYPDVFATMYKFWVRKKQK